MTSRRPVVAGNWKMNGHLELADQLVEKFATELNSDAVEVVLCPPAVFLSDLSKKLEQNRERLSAVELGIGGQNASALEKGAHTGEIAASMLKAAGCEYVILGHSERRAMYGDTPELVAEKFAQAKANGLTPILCTGESEDEREAGKTFEVIAQDLEKVIECNGKQAFDNAIIAYEPLWAIGTGKSATPEQAQEVHAFIRGHLAKIGDVDADTVRILYGGSVTPDNADELFAQADVDGGLIGGASLVADKFIKLCQLAVSAK
ncbi:triose-phosphate isomerase [Paraferrimonas sedimenticola]|uniref:Triosephosphate isomerase n=1 Tax=Paraferrimonas sedimenticola TaxID=375674 RepID=A0AA37RXT4_9GAMM|nr:triose-phosphate isomerase [Paraferrimonas sedimenticola]GLP97073.1 triosephosphate isomerase [Paraferrimonas sedimenticola]